MPKWNPGSWFLSGWLSKGLFSEIKKKNMIWPQGESSPAVLLLVLFINALSYCPPETLPLLAFLLDLRCSRHLKKTTLRISVAECLKEDFIWLWIALLYVRCSIFYSQQQTGKVVHTWIVIIVRYHWQVQRCVANLRRRKNVTHCTVGRVDRRGARLHGNVWGLGINFSPCSVDYPY